LLNESASEKVLASKHATSVSGGVIEAVEDRHRRTCGDY